MHTPRIVVTRPTDRRRYVTSTMTNVVDATGTVIGFTQEGYTPGSGYSSYRRRSHGVYAYAGTFPTREAAAASLTRSSAPA